MEYLEKNPNPTKDQHFLVDKDMIEQICDSAHIEDGESIVEIGGGSGAITDFLVSRNNSVTVIEKDPYYANYLRERYKNYENVTVVEGDALDFDYSSYDRIIANLPFTITEPLLINLARTGALNYEPSNPKGSRLKGLTLVLSQNSTRKLVSPVQITEGTSRHSNPEFGIMGAISKAFCDIDIVKAIGSDCFYPEPAVTSFLVNLTPKKEKTTVDRILREMLIDKKGSHPSLKRVYQLMLAQGKIYKVNKHKNNTTHMTSSGVISKNMENKNIYDLNNLQISQLVQDLIRNDINIKSRNNARSNNRQMSSLDAKTYFNNGFYDYFDEDFGEEEETERAIKSSKNKFERKYDYMFESTAYEGLLHRGLENITEEELCELLGKHKQSELQRILK